MSDGTFNWNAYALECEAERNALAAERDSLAAQLAEWERVPALLADFGTDDDPGFDADFYAALMAQKEAKGAGAIGMASAAIEAVKARVLALLPSEPQPEPDRDSDMPCEDGATLCGGPSPVKCWRNWSADGSCYRLLPSEPQPAEPCEHEIGIGCLRGCGVKITAAPFEPLFDDDPGPAEKEQT